jgi:hypothetical protein
MTEIPTTEIKYRSSYLISYLTLSPIAAFGSLYFLFFTKTFPATITKIAGTAASLVILYGVSWRLFELLRRNQTQLLITPDKIGFYEQKNWIELALSDIDTFSFKSFYNGSKWAKQLILQLTTGDQKIIELNGLDTTKSKLEKILADKKS